MSEAQSGTPGAFDGQYKEHLVALLLREERRERRGLFDTFRRDVDGYRQTSKGLVPWTAYRLDRPNGSTLITAIERNLRGSGVGTFDYLAVFDTEFEDGVQTRSLTTYGVSRHHYAIRWYRDEIREFTNKPPVGFKREVTEAGPSSNYGYRDARTRRKMEQRRLQEFAFTPEMHWHPDADFSEHIRVKGVLSEAIGVVACLEQAAVVGLSQSFEGMLITG